MTTATAISPADFSDAIHLLSNEGINAALDAFPALRDHHALVSELAALIEDHAALEQLTARAAVRIDDAEVNLRCAVVEEEEA